MDLKFIQGDVICDKYLKCGEIYRSPKISDKQNLFLSCLYCKDISWHKLDTFLQHLDNEHPLNLYKGDKIIEEDLIVNRNIKNDYTSLTQETSAIKVSSTGNNEKDPLDEKHYEYTELVPVIIKVERSEVAQQNEVIVNDVSINGQKNKYFHINESNSDSEENSDEDYEPNKYSINEDFDEFDEGDIDNADDKGGNVDLFNNIIDQENKKTNLKRFTKNREFIKFVINSYRKQPLLWDSAYKSKRKNSPEKQKAFKKVLMEINEKFKICATIQQIERIIKRLTLKYIHQTRLKDSGESYKPLWFYDLLTFLEPHFEENNSSNGIYKLLSDDQFLILIKLFKENECFWNENNIYHTSVIKKQEFLHSMTNSFSTICELNDFSDDVMQNVIDEVIEMARNENINKMKYLESNTSGEYESMNKFYKYIQFLFPHVGPFKCEHCLKIFTDIYAYKFHISRHDGTKPFKCMVCLRELMHKKEFVCHLRRHTKECPFQCEACDKSFPSKKEWHRHVIKHGSKPYVCELCADSFYTQHQLTNHMKNHNNIKDHVCPECGKGFTHRGLLRQHLQTHNKTKCICSICDNIYSNPRSLRKHYVRVHESVQEASTAALVQYNCKICKITFATLQDANQHRKEHKQSNPAKRKHVCDICGHYFAYPRNLADHKKTHSNIRDQVCDMCGKAFTNTNLLNQHKNVHTGEKFVCKACGKDYAHYRGLCRHITKVHGTNIRDLDAILEKQKFSLASSSEEQL